VAVVSGNRVPLKNPPRSEAELHQEEPERPYPEREDGGLYEWSAASSPAERLQLVSLLPADEGGGQAANVALGGKPGRANTENVRHAISEDGSLIVWSAEKLPTPGLEGESNKEQTHLYLRDMVIGQTVRLDTFFERQKVVGQGAKFQTASADGSTIFFSDEQRLSKDSKAEAGKPDLYACHERVVSGQLECPPEDLTVAKSGESANLQGLVIEASKEGTDVYYVADGVLSSNTNEHGEEASPGQCGTTPPPGATCNLYQQHFNGLVWEEPRFIASLSARDDIPDWAGKTLSLAGLTSRVSPNGTYLAFMSDRRLTGYDNTDASTAAGGAADEEVFLYDSSTDRLVCASCNPSGARPQGFLDREEKSLGPIVDSPAIWSGRWLGANIPGWSRLEPDIIFARYQSRYLSDEGRLFFNSSDALVPKDKNGVGDVYQYEPAGSGSCSTSPGCRALISSGESADESAFLDASENGGNVFFLTASRLLPQDVDLSYDIYDAHDCNESPCLKPPTTATQCTSSQSCQGNSTSSTNFASPLSSSDAGVAVPTPQQKTLPTKTVKPTRAQLLTKALKACEKKFKHSKKKRVACEKQAHKKYGKKAKKKSTRKKSKKASRR
jgi:hypothetical protein